MTPLMVSFANATPVGPANAISARPSKGGDAFARFLGESAPDDSVAVEAASIEEEEVEEDGLSETPDGDEVVEPILLQDAQKAAVKLRGEVADEAPKSDGEGAAGFTAPDEGASVRATIAAVTDASRLPAPATAMPDAADNGAVAISALPGQVSLLARSTKEEKTLRDLASADETHLFGKKSSTAAPSMPEYRTTPAFQGEPAAARKIETELRLSKEYGALEAEVRLHVAMDQRAESAATTASAAPTLARPVPHVAHDVLRQIASGAANRDSDRIEITLRPEELGTVRLVITGGERPAIAVYAEHSDTLDLLRRHADILARELRDSGMGGAELTFADSGGAGNRHASGADRTRSVTENERSAPVPEPQPTARAASPLRVGAQIDIRI